MKKRQNIKIERRKTENKDAGNHLNFIKNRDFEEEIKMSKV